VDFTESSSSLTPLPWNEWPPALNDSHVILFLAFRLFWARFQPFCLFISMFEYFGNDSTTTNSNLIPNGNDEMFIDGMDEFSLLSRDANLLCAPEMFPVELCHHIAMFLYESLRLEKFTASDADTASLHAFKMAHYPHYQRK
jgi:hypothetical protein